MGRSKYIIFECNDKDGKVVHVLPVLFPSQFVHADIAESIEHTRIFTDWTQSRWMWPKPVSAGFFEGTCHGRSESLDLDSRPGDTDIIRMRLLGE